MPDKLQTVHVRINDAATGKPTPCRVRFTDGQGRYYAPLGRLTSCARGVNVDVGGNLLVGAQEYAYVNGAFEIALPPGVIHIEATKGPEFTPLRQRIDLVEGKMALRLELKRWIDMRALGWYAGDARCHFLTPHAALLEGQAEDLAVVNLLIRETRVGAQDDVPESIGDAHVRAIPNIDAFSGQDECLRADNCLLAVNTLNCHPRLGSLGLLNCHRVVYPLSFDDDMPAEPRDNWTLSAWCDQCHRKNGFVIWTEAHLEPGERPAAARLGKIDALEWARAPLPQAMWYELLQSGVRMPIVGGSAKDSNSTLLGQPRTYCHLHEGEELTYRAWIDAIRLGRTFATVGPLLRFQANDAEPGACLALEQARPVRLLAEIKSCVPFFRMDIVFNGEVIAETSQARLEVEWIVPGCGWLALRCWGADGNPDCPGRQLLAHTSPVYVTMKSGGTIH